MVSDRPTSRSGGDASPPSGPAAPRSGSADVPARFDVRSDLRRLDRVPIALVTTDRDGVIRYSNLAASELLNPPASGLAHRHLLDLVADGDRTAVARQQHQALGGERRPYSVVCLQSGTRQVPCLLAAGPSPPGNGAGEIVWVIVRPGVWDVDGGDGRLTDLASALSQLSSLPLDAGVHDVVQSVATVCQIVMGSHSGVSMSLQFQGRGEVEASTSGSTQKWDRAQLAAGQGPILLAARAAAVVRSADVANDPRFPGLRGSIPPGLNAISSPLVAEETVLGVLTAYAVDDSLLEPGDTILPTLTAATAAIAQGLQARSDQSGS